MKFPMYFVFLSALLIFLQSVAFADERICHNVYGEFQIVPDPLCQITKVPARTEQYPDLMFLGELGIQDTCFTGNFNGTLGSEVITATSISGQTANLFPNPVGNKLLFSAATELHIKNTHGNFIGKLFFRDTGVISLDGANIANEQLVLIGGTKRFSGARGTLNIFGPEFTGATVTGFICTKDND